MVDDIERELAELKGFTRALAAFMILSWLVVIFVVVVIFIEINSIPAKDLDAFNNTLNAYHLVSI